MTISDRYPDRRHVAETTARMLLDIDAIRFRPDQPYRLTSGLVSPVYIDCRKIISYPGIRSIVTDFAISVLRQDAELGKIEAVAGGETAGIPFAAWIADRLHLPMLYVRKKPKGFGRNAQIEGDLHEGQRVLLVEDLATDGGSKLRFCDAIRTAGGTVEDAFVIFFYDIFPDALAALSANGVRLHALATWREVLAQCRRDNHVEPRILADVEAFLDQPLSWSGSHGGSS